MFPPELRDVAALKKAGITILVITMRGMDEADRLTILDAIAAEFCTGCGMDLRLPNDSYTICHCQNDE